MAPIVPACAMLLVLASPARGQPRSAANPDLPSHGVPLTTLRGFRPTSGNWRIAGGATADRSRPLAFAAVPGTGTIVNLPAPGASGALFTEWEHGDLDLSFDVLLPKGASSSVFFMGRYALLLSDSWGTRTPTPTSFGAIPRQMTDMRGAGHEGFEGTPPRQIVSRAPGLWQHVEVLFRAPRFSGAQKVANARFAKVTMNGVVLHESVDAPGPTEGAAFRDERTTGPLMFLGDHGPLAVRNMQYKSYAGAVVLDALHYRAYEGDSMDSAYAGSHSPIREGNAVAVAEDMGGAADKFALAYDGTLHVPATGVYRFQLDLPWIGNDSATRGIGIGGGRLTLDGAPALVHAGMQQNVYADATLTAGAHPFALSFYKNRPAFGRRDVALWVEGPAVERQALHDEGGWNASRAPTNPIVVEPQHAPVMVRSFLRHRSTKRVVAVSVADPLGVHFSYDLAQGSPLYAWRGPFLETTQMWHERGEEQLAEPLGSALTLPGTPSLSVLDRTNAVWPDSVDERQFRREGYVLDASGHPTFLAHFHGVAIEDVIRPANDGISLRRTVHLRAPAGSEAPSGLHFQLAQADHIARDGDGSWVVGDRGYYITTSRGGSRPLLRRLNGQDELIVPVRFVHGVADVAYTITW